MYVFLNQIKVAEATNRSARCCYVWYEYEMTLKYSADLGSIQHCVSILPRHPSPGDVFIMVISPRAAWECVREGIRCSPAGIPKAEMYTDSYKLHGCTLFHALFISLQWIMVLF